MPMPKRMRSTRSSRGVSDARTRVTVSLRLDWIAASTGITAFLSSMKSPRWLSSSSPIGVSRLIGSLAIFITLRTFSSGMERRSASSSGVGSRPISWRICRLVRTRLLIVSIMWTGMRMVRAWSAIERVIDRLHQADIALLDQVQELQAAVGIFLGDRDDEPQVRLDHLLLGDPRLALALLHHVDDPAELAERHAGGLGDLGDLGADALDRRRLLGAEGRPF